MKYAPALPTTERLHAQMPLTKTELDQVAVHREYFTSGMEGVLPLLVAAKGQCSTTTRDISITLKEGSQARDLTLDASNNLTIQRAAIWKPRSDPEAWHGMETTDALQAYELIVNLVRNDVATCAELAYLSHAQRYGHALTMGWIGARNRDLTELSSIADHDPSLPLLIKNHLDSSTEWTLDAIKSVQAIGSRAYLLYRGGSAVDTPQRWETAILRAIELTEGRMMLDMAHGTEQAHDPTGEFGKSIEGQIRAMEHYIKVGERTGMWANGIMLEASDAPSDTDPNMPHKIALDGIRHISRSMYEPKQAQKELVWQR